MTNEIRIPTLLGLGVLFSGLVLGVFLVIGGQTSFFTKAAPLIIPQELMVVNISHSSAAITWKTEEALTGFVSAGTSPALGKTFSDDRDSSGPTPHFLHFVSLKNLSPETTYHFKINSGQSVYPKTGTLTFKTSKEISPGSYQPLIGQVLDVTGKEVDEALVTLEIKGAQKIATVTKQGRFILPLADLKVTELNTNFQLDNTPAELKVSSQQSLSTIGLTLPLLDPILPAITLGKDFTITPKIASISAQTSTPSASAAPKVPNFDLNNDKRVNSLDYSIVLDNLGKSPKNKDTDLNFDGIVDKKDLDLMNQHISTNSSR